MTTVLVTGASTGIGAATARRLVADDWLVWVGVRDPGAVAELDQLGNPRLRAIELDITDAGSIGRAAARLGAEGGVDAVVNNAGIGIAGPLELLTDEELREQLEVNLVGQLAVTRATLPLLRASKRPRILFVSSVGGVVAFPFAGAYSASKFALEAVVEALRNELGEEGIPVALIEPASISTPIWDKALDRLAVLKERPRADIYAERLEGFAEILREQDRSGDDPDAVAATIERALGSSRPSARYPVGIAAQVATRLRALVPDRAFDALARRIPRP